MIRKLFWIIVILFVVYILSIFKVPNIADGVEKLLGIEGFNEFVINFKKTFDETITNLPTKDEVANTYENTLSGAIELKDKFIDGVNITKDKIDDVRHTLSGAEDTLNQAKEKYNEAKEFIEENQETIDNFSNLKDTFTGSGYKK